MLHKIMSELVQKGRFGWLAIVFIVCKFGEVSFCPALTKLALDLHVNFCPGFRLSSLIG